MIATVIILSFYGVLVTLVAYQLMRRLVCLEASIRRETDQRIAELYELFLSKSAAEIDRFVFEGEREKENHQYRMEKLKTRRDMRLGELVEEPVDEGVPIESGASFG